jgi:chromosome segregation ATPase
MPPTPVGFQPFEWGVICVLFVALLSLVLYIWRDSRARGEKERLATEGSVTALSTTLNDTVKNFSNRVDETIKDIRLNARELSLALQKLGERMAVIESRREDTRDEQQQVRNELTRLNEAMNKLGNTVARIAGQMGITQSSTSATFVPPVPRADRR